MIPPLLMDIKPGMTVLDMCAAPGSKAAQLLEMVHNGEEARVRAALRKYAKEDGRKEDDVIKPKEEADEEELALDPKDYGRATGLLIANDADYKRSHMLIHQLKRLSSPNLIVTNHDATMFPSIKLPATDGKGQNKYLKFDRILADVPCSGDGTCRKNPNLWADWTGGNALGLHSTQVKILLRALQMLKVGGRVVYSTCSMNPSENEAIIATAIDRCGGLDKVELIDCSAELPLLKRRPGLKTWQIMDKPGTMWSNWAEVQDYVEANGEGNATKHIVEGMFPPTHEDLKQIPLERCMRVYPFLQDTGGFFIAVLEKKSEIKTRPEGDPRPVATSAPITAIVNEIESTGRPVDGQNVAPKIEAANALGDSDELMVNVDNEVAPVARQNQEGSTPDATTGSKREYEADEEEVDAEIETKKLKVKEDLDEPADLGLENRDVHYPPPPGAQLDLTTRPGDMRREGGNNGKKRNGGQTFEEPFKYISAEHDEVQDIEKFYSLSPRFPRDRFMVRNATGEPVKTIYYTSKLIREIFEENEGKGIKFVHGGVRMFMKQDVQGDGVCRWRIQSEGMPILEGYVGEERVVRLYKKETLRKLLIEMFPKVNDGGWKDLGEIGERVRDIGMGCCVLRVEPSSNEDGFEERLVMPLWRSLHSLNLMLAKEDRSALLLRLFNDTSALVNNSHPRKPENAQEETIRDGGDHVDTISGSIEASGTIDEEVEAEETVDVEV